jgi:hypothetical protein
VQASCATAALELNFLPRHLYTSVTCCIFAASLALASLIDTTCPAPSRRIFLKFQHDIFLAAGEIGLNDHTEPTYTDPCPSLQR